MLCLIDHGSDGMATQKKKTTKNTKTQKPKYYALIIKKDDAEDLPDRYVPAGSLIKLKEVYDDVTEPFQDTRPALRRVEARMDLYELDTLPNMKDVKDNIFAQAYYGLIQDLDDLVDEKVDLKKIAIKWGTQLGSRASGTAKTTKGEALDVFDAAKDDVNKIVKTFKNKKGGSLGTAWRTSVAGTRTVKAATKLINNLFGAGKNIIDAATDDYSTEESDGLISENGYTLIHTSWLVEQEKAGKARKLNNISLVKSAGNTNNKPSAPKP
jgi:hypothetical protein